MRFSHLPVKLSFSLALLLFSNSTVFAQDPELVSKALVSTKVIDSVPDLYQPPRPTQ